MQKINSKAEAPAIKDRVIIQSPVVPSEKHWAILEQLAKDLPRGKRILVFSEFYRSLICLDLQIRACVHAFCEHMNKEGLDINGMDAETLASSTSKQIQFGKVFYQHLYEVNPETGICTNSKVRDLPMHEVHY